MRCVALICFLTFCFFHAAFGQEKRDPLYFEELKKDAEAGKAGAQKKYFDELKKEAEAGKAWAQDSLGVYYSEVLNDNKTAVYWFKKSAAQGHVLGSCNLALHYAWAKGVAKNPVLSLKWAFVSHSLDGLKCFPDDFLQFFKPTKAQIKKAWALTDTFLLTHPELKNNFGERPWFDAQKKNQNIPTKKN